MCSSDLITGLNDGNWHHIAHTVNYSNGDVKFYKDGSESSRSEERRVGKECRSRWSPYH